MKSVLIKITRADGSTPREVGTQMIVTHDGYRGTIGGGALEWQALARAQKMLQSGEASSSMTMSLGPDLGQCCGGRVTLALTSMQDAQTSAHTTRNFLLFGAGHVGRALVLALAPLPFSVTWTDTRPNAFPGAAPANTQTLETQSSLQALAEARDGTFIAVMTHSHALDFEIVDAALSANRFPYIGLIGSDTKRARFVSRLRDAGHSDDAINQLICPIGTKTVQSKHPAAIAAGIVVQLLERDEALARNSLPLRAVN